MSAKAGRIGDIVQVDNKNPHRLAARNYSHLRVQTPDGKEVHLLFTDSDIERAKERALKNPEDLPKTSWIRNLLD